MTIGGGMMWKAKINIHKLKLNKTNDNK